MASDPIPDHIEMYGDRFTITICDEIKDRDGSSICGMVDYDSLIIFLARYCDGEALTHEQMLDTLVHEIIHIGVRGDGPPFEAAVTRAATEIARAVTHAGITHLRLRKQRG